MSARLVAFTASLAIAAGVLVGCDARPPEISSEAAVQMQTTVASIAESASAGDPAAALAMLDALQRQLETARENGAVSAERAAAIQTRIDAVRADLQPAVQPEPEAPGDPGDTGQTVDSGDGSEDGGNDDSGNDGNNGNGNGGNGNGGNGNGGSGNGGSGNGGKGNGNSGKGNGGND